MKTQATIFAIKKHLLNIFLLFFSVSRSDLHEGQWPSETSIWEVKKGTRMKSTSQFIRIILHHSMHKTYSTQFVNDLAERILQKYPYIKVRQRIFHVGIDNCNNNKQNNNTSTVMFVVKTSCLCSISKLKQYSYINDVYVLTVILP